jgi:hypothetical protein
MARQTYDPKDAINRRYSGRLDQGDMMERSHKFFSDSFSLTHPIVGRPPPLHRTTFLCFRLAMDPTLIPGSSFTDTQIIHLLDVLVSDGKVSLDSLSVSHYPGFDQNLLQSDSIKSKVVIDKLLASLTNSSRVANSIDLPCLCSWYLDPKYGKIEHPSATYAAIFRGLSMGTCYCLVIQVIWLPVCNLQSGGWRMQK